MRKTGECVETKKVFMEYGVKHTINKMKGE